MVRDVGLEPTNLSVLGPKPSAFANFASRAQEKTAGRLLPGASTPVVEKARSPYPRFTRRGLRADSINIVPFQLIFKPETEKKRESTTGV